MSEWTHETLLVYLLAMLAAHDQRYEQRFLAQDKALEHALESQRNETRQMMAASEKAVEKAEIYSQQWRVSANEWRQAMTDREQRFYGREEARQALKGLADKQELLMARMDRQEGRGAGFQASWAIVIAVVGIGLVVVGLLVRR